MGGGSYSRKKGARSKIKKYKKKAWLCHRAKDTDQIQDELEKSAETGVPAGQFEYDDELPGGGQFYCVETGKHFADAKALAAALPKALAAAMTTTVVPKFEKATSEMFAQVKSTFERGMDELAAELYTQKENAIAAEAEPLVRSLRGAADEVRAAAETLAARARAAVVRAAAGMGPARY